MSISFVCIGLKFCCAVPDAVLCNKEKIESCKQFNDYLFNLILTTKQRTLKPNDKLYNKILANGAILIKDISEVFDKI